MSFRFYRRADALRDTVGGTVRFRVPDSSHLTGTRFDGGRITDRPVPNTTASQSTIP